MIKLNFKGRKNNRHLTEESELLLKDILSKIIPQKCGVSPNRIHIYPDSKIARVYPGPDNTGWIDVIINIKKEKLTALKFIWGDKSSEWNCTPVEEMILSGALEKHNNEVQDVFVEEPEIETDDDLFPNGLLYNADKPFTVPEFETIRSQFINKCIATIKQFLSEKHTVSWIVKTLDLPAALSIDEHGELFILYLNGAECNFKSLSFAEISYITQELLYHYFPL